MVKVKVKIKIKFKSFTSILMVIHYAKTTKMAMATKIWLISMEARTLMAISWA